MRPTRPVSGSSIVPTTVAIQRPKFNAENRPSVCKRGHAWYLDAPRDGVIGQYG
jgi:hypothetical protein